ncbi:MAG: alanine--tRNA ligase [Patescibacteria group bacterium]
MTSEEIRNHFLAFFKSRGHTILPSASLIPENDPTVLFTTAGMQPLIPYLLGTPHPQGKKLVNVQKCVRTGDLEEIGDNRHFSFFEMMGNWSLGSYFKDEAINWSYEFLTSEKEGLGLNPERLYVTCFEGDEDAPKDEDSHEVWIKTGIPKERIYFLGAEENWWSPGDNGPCGPDTEIFYDMTKDGLGKLSKKEFIDAVKKEDLIEIWNDVFMEYEKKDGRVIGKLSQKNVDTGAGLERISALMQKKKTAYDTDLFEPIMNKIKDFSLNHDTKAMRIVADHIRTSVFLIADGVIPSNTDQGYILRRLLRRAVSFADKLKMKSGDIFLLADIVIEKYKNVYSNLKEKETDIKREINNEEIRFRKTLNEGLKELQKMSYGAFAIHSALSGNLLESGGLEITGKNLFVLYSTYGFPFELSIEELQKMRTLLSVSYKGFNILSIEEVKKLKIDFDRKFKEHQQISRIGADKKFKGGLGDKSEMSIKYHTATHLLHQALRDALGDKVYQKGSNITPERLRFDFSYGEKMTSEQKKLVEDLVNDKIKQSLPVTYEDLEIIEAQKRGAIGLFEEKYGDLSASRTDGQAGKVRVYKIGNFSLEFCGGPHVGNTKELGIFKIEKEEAVSAGVRRIKATIH